MSVSSSSRVTITVSQDFSQNMPEIEFNLREAVKAVDPRLKGQEISVLGIEELEGQKVCKLKVDLSHFEGLQQQFGRGANPNNTELQRILLGITGLGMGLSVFGIDSLKIVDLNLAHTMVSGSGVNNTAVTGLSPLNLLTRLDLSFTQTTNSLLSHLEKLPALKELILDSCNHMQTVPSSANALSTTLEKISLVRSATVDKNLLKAIEKAFPQVTALYFTQPYNAEAKFLGIKDIVTLATAIEPVALKGCGHVIGKTTAEKITKCTACRKVLQTDKYFPARFPISLINKEDGKWVTKVLDYARVPLRDGVNTYFHPVCYHLFTEETCKALFNLDTVNMAALKTIFCPGCMELNPNIKNPLEGAVQLFVELTPNDSFEDSMQKSTLSDVGMYANTAALRGISAQPSPSTPSSAPAIRSPIAAPAAAPVSSSSASQSSAPTIPQQPIHETRAWASAIAQRSSGPSISSPSSQSPEAAVTSSSPSQSSAPTPQSLTGSLYNSEELTYPARSLLGTIYQMIINQKEISEIRSAIGNLASADIRRVLAQLDLRSSTVNDPIVLFNAVKKAIISKLQDAPVAQRNEAYRQIWEKAGKPQTNDRQWGEHHAYDNLIRLADLLVEMGID